MKRNNFNGTMLQNEKFAVEITEDDTYTVGSVDNVKYDCVMNPLGKRRTDRYKVLRILVSGENNYSIALIGDYLTSAYDCALLDGERLTVLQNDYITQIDLSLKQITGGYELECDGVNFALYRIADGYIIYGEIEIKMLDRDFHELWSFSGKDIFVSTNGKEAFELTDSSVRLYDFEGNFYELDFCGKLIS